MVTPAAFTTAATGAPEGQQGRYLGVATAGMTAALFTGVPVGTWLGDTVGWRATFWLIAAVGSIAAVGVSATAPRVPGSVPAPLRERLAPLRRAAVLRLVTVAFLAASGGLMFYTYLSAYVTTTTSGSGALLSVVLLVVGLAGLAGAVLAGRITDRLRHRANLRGVIGGHALALLLAAGLGFTPVGGAVALVVMLAMIAFWAVFAWGLNPPVQGSIMAAAGEHAVMITSQAVLVIYGSGLTGGRR